MHSNSISNLLNIKGVIIKKVEHLSTTIHIHIDTKPSQQTCPCCESVTNKVHDYRLQRIKHFPINHKAVLLIFQRFFVLMSFVAMLVSKSSNVF